MKIYKLRRISDEMFATKSSYNVWDWTKDKGTPYTTLTGIKHALKDGYMADMVGKNIRDYEVVEFELKETTSYLVKTLI